MSKNLSSPIFIFLLLSLFTSSVISCESTTPDAKTPPPPTLETTVTPVSSRISRDQILIILNPEAPSTLNPHLSLSVKDLETSRITYEPLASFDAEGNLVPFLAKEIPSLENSGLAEDGKSVTWYLRDDVFWSDGEAFTADDVLFTYEYVTNEEVSAPSISTYTSISNIEVIDPYTIKLYFEETNPAWATPFVGLQGAILPRHIFQDYNNENYNDAPANKLPIGTGPYRVKKPGIKILEVWMAGDAAVETNKIVFERNPYYRDADNVYFQQIEWLGGSIPSEVADRLELGLIDLGLSLDKLSPEDLASVEGSENIDLILNFGSKVSRLQLNHTDPNKETASGERSSLENPHPFFSDKLVRQAFAHAINREEIATLYGPTGQSTTNNLVSPLAFNSPNIFYDYDPVKAEHLLDEAGWLRSGSNGFRSKDGERMKVLLYSAIGSIPQETQKIIVRNLESIGVEVEEKLIDTSIYYGDPEKNPDSVWRFNADLQELPIRSTNPDPSGFMLLWTCSQIPQQANKWKGINIERWCNEEYDNLYQQVTTELDPEKRRNLFIQMNDIQMEDVAMIPLAIQGTAQGKAKSLTGLNPTPWDAITWNIQEWRRTSP